MPLPLQETLANAWQKVKGTKLTIWLGICVYLLILVPIIFLNNNLLTDLLLTLFNAGLLNLGIKRAQNSPIHYQQIFYSLKPSIILRLVVVAIVKYIITLLPILIFILLIGGLLRIIPAANESILVIAKPVGLIIVMISLVYLQIRMILSTAFILDRHADFWSAIQLSFHATRGYFWTLLLLYLITLFAILLSAIPFGIGLIWSLPFAIILYGTVYTTLVAPVTKPTPQKRAFNA